MTESRDLRIAVVGLGVVGMAVKRYFEDVLRLKRNHRLFLYDIDSKKNFQDEINQGDIVFVCVSTPARSGGLCDLSAIESILSRIENNKIVVIKSTVPPGTTEKFQREHPHLKLLFNPEFLTEKQAWEDFIKPDRQIVGFTEKSLDAAHFVLSLLPKAPFMSPWGIDTYQSVKITATEAEIIKYGSNVWFVRKINFANVLAQLSDSLAKEFVTKVSYEQIRLGMAADFRIGPSHLDIHHNGYRGWGGRCFPKDLLAFLGSLKEMGLMDCVSLLQSDLHFNEKILTRQGLSLDQVTKSVDSSHEEI